MLYIIFITLDFRQQTSHSSSAHKTLWKNPSNCQNSGIFRVEVVYIALYRYHINHIELNEFSSSKLSFYS